MTANEPTLAELQAYHDALRVHDWNYEYSDDRLKYRKGSDERRVLRTKAQEHPKFEEMYQSFVFAQHSHQWPARPE